MVQGGVGPWRSRRRSSAPRQEQLNILITVENHRLEQGGPPEFAAMATLTTLTTIATLTTSFFLRFRPQVVLLVRHRCKIDLSFESRLRQTRTRIIDFKMSPLETQGGKRST